MEKWIVDVTEAQLDLLSEEQRDLGTVLRADDKTLLVFRDGFVALKIAAQLGTQRLPGRPFSDTRGPQLPVAHLDDGDVLITESA